MPSIRKNSCIPNILFISLLTCTINGVPTCVISRWSNIDIVANAICLLIYECKKYVSLRSLNFCHGMFPIFMCKATHTVDKIFFHRSCKDLLKLKTVNDSPTFSLWQQAFFGPKGRDFIPEILLGACAQTPPDR